MRVAVRKLVERSHPQAQALIGDLVATYWPEGGGLIPSAALVDLLQDFGLSAASCRTALSRLVRKGRIMRTQVGRRTFYRQTADGARRVFEVREQVLSFGSAPHSWDRRWLVVAFNVPEHERALRHLLRSRLRAAGFRPLYDAVWISPRGTPVQAREILADIGVERAHVFDAKSDVPIDGVRLFDLDQVGAGYRAFLDDFAPFAERSDLSPAEALLVRTIAWDRWRELVQADPDLPNETLGPGWRREEAHHLFARLHGRLEALARERVSLAVLSC